MGERVQAVAQPEHAQQQPEIGADFAAAREAVLDRFADTPMAYTVNGVTYRASGAYEAMMLCPHLQDETISAEYLEYKFEEAAGLAIETPEDELEDPDKLLGTQTDTEEADDDLGLEEKETTPAVRHEADNKESDEQPTADKPGIGIATKDSHDGSGQQAEESQTTVNNFVVHERFAMPQEVTAMHDIVEPPLLEVQQPVAQADAVVSTEAIERSDMVEKATRAVVELLNDTEVATQDNELFLELGGEVYVDETHNEPEVHVFSIPALSIEEELAAPEERAEAVGVVDLYRPRDTHEHPVVNLPAVESPHEDRFDEVVGIDQDEEAGEQEKYDDNEEAPSLTAVLENEIDSEMSGDEDVEYSEPYERDEPEEATEMFAGVSHDVDDTMLPVERVVVAEEQYDTATSMTVETKELLTELIGEEPDIKLQIENAAVYRQAEETVRRIEILEQVRSAVECKEAVEELREELALLLRQLGYADAEHIAERLTKQYDLVTLKKYIAILLQTSLTAQTKDEKPLVQQAASQLPYHRYGAQVVRMVVRYAKQYQVVAA